MKNLLLVLISLLSLSFSSAQTGYLGRMVMEGNRERVIDVYDLMEIYVKVPEIEALGFPLVDMIDLPDALLDSARRRKIHAYDVGLYYKPTGYGNKLNARQLKPVDIDNILYMQNGELIEEYVDIYLIGVELDGTTPKYLHLFIRGRGHIEESIIKYNQLSDAVISFRFEELPLFFIR